MKRIAVAALGLLATSALAQTPPAAPRSGPPLPGQPPLTKHTTASGLPLTTEQAAVSFDHADLAFEILPDSGRISGIATLSFTPRAPLRRFQLDLDRNLPISAVALDGRPLPKAAWTNPDGRLTVSFPRALRAGQRFALRIAYGGQPHVAVRAPWDGGFVWAKTESGKPWIASAKQGEGCDLLWPCIDHPTGEPALVDLHITVPAGLSAPANGKLLKIDTLADGRRTFHWQAKHINPYTISITVGPYTRLQGSYRSRYGNVIPMEFWHLEGRDRQAAELFREFSENLDFYETMIGPYPFADEKLGAVETPHLGMEHQTINAYGNGYKKDGRGFDWLFNHELAHEWFGNQLTNSDWDHFWLHEGFGAYMQPLYGEWRRGKVSYFAQLQSQSEGILNNHPIVSGRSRIEHEVGDNETGPGIDVYYKAAWMLHTLRNLIGDPAFFEATRRLVYGRPDPKPGNFSPRFATSEDFQRIVTQVAGQDHDWFFDAYLRHAKLPDLVTERQGGRMTLRWETPSRRTFKLPVEVQVGDRVVRLPMTDGTGTIDVPEGAHVTLDPNSLVLRRQPDLEAKRVWDQAEAARKAAATK